MIRNHYLRLFYPSFFFFPRVHQALDFIFYIHAKTSLSFNSSLYTYFSFIHDKASSDSSTSPGYLQGISARTCSKLSSWTCYASRRRPFLIFTVSASNISISKTRILFFRAHSLKLLIVLPLKNNSNLSTYCHF